MESMVAKFRWHDFRRPGWYHITLECAVRGRNVLAEIGPRGFRETPLDAIASREWRETAAKTGGALVTHAFQTMPDHVHVLIHVAKPLDKPLGRLIGAYKAATTAAARAELGFSKDRSLWKPGFDWRLKTTPEEVAAARTYTQDNPAAAREKQAARARWGAPAPLVHPRLPGGWPDGLEAGPVSWTAFGNPALLDAERFVAVRVSQREGEARLRAMEARAEELAREGAVLVSPAISPGEKRALAAALRAGGRAIHVENRPIDRFYKPGPARLAALKDGRFLAVSPIPAGNKRKLDRPLCEALNACAREIAEV